MAAPGTIPFRSPKSQKVLEKAKGFQGGWGGRLGMLRHGA